ncbi:chemotaxis protein CheW [Catenovulum sp. 2E275]|uniref:chemotaxis protein CheW n=1 Tax=Catenovulum sp. 2E275 TaxID=2980497 RepID=UPI0021CDFE69|nr:chemotaxis protein CheW [Catenovulum sp. 2E275]MCU4674938.1 chemotaxis protein CheW [Catenovulum sp. 2E275]
MTKGSFANEEIMEEYLDALLSEDEVVSTQSKPTIETSKPVLTTQDNPVERLLDQVKPEVFKEQATKPVTDIIEKTVPTVQAEVTETHAVKLNISQEAVYSTADLSTQIKADKKSAESTPGSIIESAAKGYQQGEFQALFFEVAGLLLAVPLTELGGIHNLTETSPLFGKPNWFKGVMLNRDEKINVVDSAQWVMPEKCQPELVNTLSYKYIIMLGESNWGLACEKLVNTVTLKQEDIKWRAAAGKRPWLAGLVKEKMCALLDVEQLITLLNKGLDSQDS